MRISTSEATGNDASDTTSTSDTTGSAASDDMRDIPRDTVKR